MNDELYEMLGAVYGWCHREKIEVHRRIECEGMVVTTIIESWLVNEYVWFFLYWPAGPKRIVRPVVNRRPLAIRAGYMSRSRGRHWKRNNNQ